MKSLQPIYIIGLLLLIFVSHSCKTASLTEARKEYLRGEYYAASESYRTVYRNLKPQQRAMRGVVAYEMGEVYRKLNMPARASNAYANAIRYNYPDTLMQLSYAKMLQRQGKYNEAEVAYHAYLEQYPDNYFAQVGLAGVELTERMNSNPTRHKVSRADFFNSNRSEFSPLLARDDTQLYITSSRSSYRTDSVSDITGMKDNDLFISVKNDKGEWERPQRINSEINTDLDEGTPSISGDGSRMYYTLSPLYYDRPSQPRIYVAQRGADSWNAGRELSIQPKDSTSLFAHPSITPSGDWLYFVSDMSGGYGDKDIWRAAMRADEVLYVENMGPEINTPGDELFPTAVSDSVIYFSSDGHPGMGGLDLFEARLDKSGIEWHVTNMGYPINSSMDDFGITFEQNRKSGYFSSNRDDARGRDHIYRIDYPELSIQIEGFVVDQEERLLPDTQIHLIADDGTQQKLTTNKQGTYKFTPIQGRRYLLMAQADGFLNQRQSVTVSTAEKDSTYFVDFQLIPYNVPVVLENIFYDFDSATLRDESKEELGSLVALMNEYPEISLELSAHTDRKGSAGYNQNLSLRRAQSVVAYLVNNGIAPQRLTAVGYGKEQPKEVSERLAERYPFLSEGTALDEQTIEQLTEEEQSVADQINRRTEFKVIDTTLQYQREP